MKKLLLLTTLITFVLGVSAQTTLFEDDFESYTVGTGVADQSDTWDTWSSDPGSAEDALVSDDYAQSGSKTMLVEGTNDMILPLGNKTSGSYNVSFSYYLESGFGGYFNIQHFEAPGNEWAYEVYMSDDGTGYLSADGQDIDFTYPQDQWFFIENQINIDDDVVTLYIDGVEIHTWSFATVAGGGAGEPQLGGVNFYAGVPNDETPKYYVDDVMYVEGATLFADGFEPPYEVGTGVADQSDVWDTWSSDPGSAEDALVSDDYAHNGTQSMVVEGTNDMILPLGNKTSGVYDVNFWYYLETGFGGYFNIQHFEAPGNEWAFEVYMSDDGTGYLSADGQDIDFTYPQDTWFAIENHIDIDADEVTLTLNGTDIHTWQFSTVAGGGSGELQLGGVNFYAGVPNDETPKYYVDDVEYILAESGLTPPSIAVDTEELMVYETGSGVDSEVISLENTGEQDLNYHAYPVYPQAGTKASSAKEETRKRVVFNRKSAERPQTTYTESETGVSFNPENRDGTLTHVQSDLTSGFGYTNPVTVRAAAKYRPQDVESYIGMKIDQVIIYHQDLPADNSTTLRIWDRGDFITPGPGEIIAEQSYTPAGAGSQTPISITEDIYIDGKDIWVGYECDDLGEENFPLGTDNGPIIEGVNYTSTGPGWSEYDATFGNLGIIVELVGDGIPSWMSLTPEMGTITPGNTEEILVDFTSAGLENGVYESEIHIGSNDPDAEYTAIPVTLDISTAIIDGTEEKVGVMTYPNPAVDNLNVKSNDVIETVKVINQVGQVVYEGNPNTESFSINTSNLERGMYMVQVQTVNSETITHKVVVK